MWLHGNKGCINALTLVSRKNHKKGGVQNPVSSLYTDWFLSGFHLRMLIISPIYGLVYSLINHQTRCWTLLTSLAPCWREEVWKTSCTNSAWGSRNTCWVFEISSWWNLIMPQSSCFHGGFLQWGWMVYNGKSLGHGWFRGTPMT